MGWRIYIKRIDDQDSYRAFKVVQNTNNGDITVIPHNAVHIPREVVEDANMGEQLKVTTKIKGAYIHHYSAHSTTGQRHIKFSDKDFAAEVVNGNSFKNLNTVVPLFSLITTMSRSPDPLPLKSSKKWFGQGLPNDVNYCIFDLYAIPKGKKVNFNIKHQIVNTKMSREYFNQFIIPQHTLDVLVHLRASNHDQSSLPYNVLVTQTEGKTAQVVRVMENEVLLEVSGLSILGIN